MWPRVAEGGARGSGGPMRGFGEDNATVVLFRRHMTGMVRPVCLWCERRFKMFISGKFHQI
jgi:hypothetical protein